jgi:hypothetical protein
MTIDRLDVLKVHQTDGLNVSDAAQSDLFDNILQWIAPPACQGSCCLFIRQCERSGFTDSCSHTCPLDGFACQFCHLQGPPDRLTWSPIHLKTGQGRRDLRRGFDHSSRCQAPVMFRPVNIISESMGLFFDLMDNVHVL